MKTKTTPTPGPWPLKVINSDAYQLTVITAQGNHYATTFDPSAARLIAAAPDLLENAREEERQAEDIIAAVDEAFPDMNECPIWAQSVRQNAVGMRDDARAAIAKAEGK